jgi:O-antigen ligase
MPALAAVSALIGLVWGGLYALRGSLAVGCLLVLLAQSCFGFEFVHFDLGPIPMTIDRAVLAVLIVTLVVQRAIGRTDPKPMSAADWITVAFIGYLLVNMFTSDWREVQKGQVSPLWRWIGGYFTPLVLFWCAKQAPWSERTVRIVLAGFSLFGVYLGVTAILEITGQWWAVFPQYIADPKIGLHFGRARGPMVHGVSFGHYQAVCLLAAWIWATMLTGHRRVCLAMLMPLFFGGVYFSYTRSVWMGAGLGLCLVLLLTLSGRARTTVLGGVALVALVVGATQMEKIVGFQREQSAVDTADSANLRVSFAYVSWLMFQDKPIFGFGFGRFPIDKLPYLSDRSTDLNLEALRPYVHHNAFLSILVDTGLVGLSLFLAMLVLWCRDGWRTCRLPQAAPHAKGMAALSIGAVGVYVCQLAFHELSYTPLDNSLVFFLAGAASALAARSSSTAAADRLPMARRVPETFGEAAPA